MPNYEPVFPSTTWEEKVVKVRRRPQGPTPQRAKRSAWYSLRRRSIRLKTVVTLQYKGGSEPWVLVEARGKSGIVDGTGSIYDLLLRVNNAWEWGDERGR